MEQRLLIALPLLAACASAPEPATTASLSLPVAPAAVGVSSARFLGLDPTASLSNSEMRNCRFGRTEKLNLVPVVLEWTPQSLRFQGRDVAALTDGQLPTDLSAVQAPMAALASHNRELAGSGCHPWRASPDDPSMVPALLIAADGGLPGDGLARLSALAAQSGLIHQAVRVSAEGPRPVEEQAQAADSAVLLQARAADRVADVVAGVSDRRAQGLACVQLVTDRGTPPGATGTTAPAAELTVAGTMPVVPLFQPAAGAERMVSGERCPAPPSAEDAVQPGDLLDD